MRKLGPLIALALLALLGGSSSALAAWTSPSEVNATYFASTTQPRAAFDATGTGGTLVDGGSGFVIRSTDSGATWPGTPLGLPSTDYKFATYGAGNRVWVWPAGGGNLKVLRTGPDAVPTIIQGTTLTTGIGASSTSIVANSSGDALIAWTSNGSRNAEASFWKAGESTPRAPQTFTIPTDGGSNSASVPSAFLDPDGAASVVWNHAISGGSSSSQVATANADTTPFGGATTLLAGGNVYAGGAGQATDGRAIVLLREETAISPNTYGVSVAIKLKYATRPAGGSFGPPTLLDGDNDHVAVEASLSVGSGGATAIGWRNAVNWTGDHECAEMNQASKSKAAVGVLTAGGIGLSAKTLSGDTSFGYSPRVAAGTDGRSGVVWEERTDCGTPATKVRGFQFTTDGSGLSPGGDAPAYVPSALIFNHCGNVLAFGIPSGAGAKFSSSRFDIAPALDCSGDPGSDPGGGDPGGGGGTNPPPATPFTATLGKVKAKKGGTATVGVGVAGASAIAAAVLFKGKPAVKVTKYAPGPGTTTLSFKLKGAALKQLKKKKKLKLKATFTVTPADGSAAKKLSVNITFKK